MSSQELPHAQQAESKHEVPSPDAAASSDAIFPSSPSPVKKTIENVEEGNKEPDHNLKKNANVKDDSKLPAETAPSNQENSNPRLTLLTQKHTHLTSKLAELQRQRATYTSTATLPSGLAMPTDWTDEQKAKQALETANGVIKEHIALLHSYNEIKDIGQGLMGLVADKRGVRVADVMEEFGMGEKD